MNDRTEGVERRTAAWRCAEPGAGSGDGGVPLVYVALYSHVLDSLVQRWHGNVPEHLVFFLHSMSEFSTLLRNKKPSPAQEKYVRGGYTLQESQARVIFRRSAVKVSEALRFWPATPLSCIEDEDMRGTILESLVF
jgi:hypothetical protein